MVFRYMSRISFLEYRVSICRARFASRILRSMDISVASLDSSVLRTSCWVMVEAPSRLPPRMLL